MFWLITLIFISSCREVVKSFSATTDTFVLQFFNLLYNFMRLFLVKHCFKEFYGLKWWAKELLMRNLLSMKFQENLYRYKKSSLAKMFWCFNEEFLVEFFLKNIKMFMFNSCFHLFLPCFNRSNFYKNFNYSKIFHGLLFYTFIFFLGGWVFPCCRQIFIFN